MTIYAQLLGFHDSIFNQGYISDHYDENRLDFNNRALWEFLKEKKASFQENSKSVLMVFSRRQSKAADDERSETTAILRDSRDREFMKRIYVGSGFTAIEKIKHILKEDYNYETTVDPYLLADSYGYLDEGTSFRRATDEEYQGKHTSCYTDINKIDILYCHAHHLAKLYPYEDKIYMDIYVGHSIEGLASFYANNHDLLPQNVIVNFYYYQGDIPEHRHQEIIGSGAVDEFYPSTLRIATNKLTVHRQGHDRFLDIDDELSLISFRGNLELMQHVKQGIITASESIISTLKTDHKSSAIQSIYIREELEKITLGYYESMQGHHVNQDLLEKVLRADLDNFIKELCTKMQLSKQEQGKIIRVLRMLLHNFINLILCVVGYGIYRFYQNQQQTGHYLFYCQPKSFDTLYALKNTLAQQLIVQNQHSNDHAGQDTEHAGQDTEIEPLLSTRSAKIKTC